MPRLSEEVSALKKYRIKFEKGDEIRFIGHLDVMRIFQKSIRRAELPICYSNGFNPHQELYFANPLNLGMTSSAEYMDFKLSEEISPSEIKEKLNEVLPKGVLVLSVVPLSENIKTSMADVCAASYTAEISDERLSNIDLDEKIKEFLALDEIIILKKTKRYTKDTNIRNEIFEIKNISENGKLRLHLCLALSSIVSLKAELLMNAFYNFLEIPFDKYLIRYERTELLRMDNGERKPLNVGVSEGCE